MEKKEIALDFIVDKLTNSIENIITGDSFATDISIVTFSDLKNVTKKISGNSTGGMNTNNLNGDVYKLTITSNESIIQGLVSLGIKSDHVYCALLKAHRSTKEKQKYMQAFPEIWSHSFVNFPLKAEFVKEKNNLSENMHYRKLAVVS